MDHEKVQIATTGAEVLCLFTIRSPISSASLATDFPPKHIALPEPQHSQHGARSPRLTAPHGFRALRDPPHCAIGAVTVTNPVDLLSPLGFVPWPIPRGGFYLWCRLPDGQDSALMPQRCMEENVVLAPGNVFSVSQSASAFMRINVTQLSDTRVIAAIDKAMQNFGP